MAIVISGVNNNDKITASDGTIDLLSGVNYVGIITAPAISATGNLTAASINVDNNIQLGTAGIVTATTFVGNVTGNINNSTLLLQTGGTERVRITSTGNVEIANDLDVDGHTNLDNVSISGVTTIRNSGGTKLYEGSGNGSKLFHAGAERLSTELYGIDINGTLGADQVNCSGIVTATSFTPTAVTAQLSHRNILHNGEFKVIQRYGTSFTINQTSDSEFYIDRWYVASNDNLGDFTVSQEADAPAGFRTSVKIQSTSTDTSSAGSEQAFIQQTVEAQNISHIFNGSGSQPMTLSFYYKSAQTTQRQLWFFTPDTSRHYSAVFTPSATNTWERFTIPIPADTSNTIDDDTGGGFYVRFLIGSGTIYKNGRPTSWTGLSNNRYSGVTNLGESTANNFYITGVQLEMGSQATPYEHRTMSEELVNCQRYYYPYKSILKGASSGGNRPWVPVQLFLNSASNNDVFVVIAGLNEQRAKMRTGSAEVRILAPLNSAPVTTLPSAGEWAYFYRGQGSGYYSGGTAFTWNDGYYNMYGVKSSANPRPTQIMIETNAEVGKVYVELDDEI